ncbi:MAG: hypothetical protein JNK80_02550 [Dechloromonas sp.]|nr:hypothetical protein [Dechloromonas sp.]
MGKRRVSRESVIVAGGDWNHFDVMDNHYVPGLTIGWLAGRAIRSCTAAPIGARDGRAGGHCRWPCASIALSVALPGAYPAKPQERMTIRTTWNEEHRWRRWRP